MTLRDKILKQLKKHGYEVTKTHFYNNWGQVYWQVYVKYNNKRLNWECLKEIKNIDLLNGYLNWDIKSVEKYISSKIQTAKIEIYELAMGELPMSTRRYRKTYLLDPQSKIRPTRKGGCIRPLLLAPYYTLDYLIRNAKKTIEKCHLKKYKLIIEIYFTGTFGGYIGVGQRKN